MPTSQSQQVCGHVLYVVRQGYVQPHHLPTPVLLLDVLQFQRQSCQLAGHLHISSFCHPIESECTCLNVSATTFQLQSSDDLERASFEAAHHDCSLMISAIVNECCMPKQRTRMGSRICRA